MLAPSKLPEHYGVWNGRHGAPFGHTRPNRRLLRRFYSDQAWRKLRGPFSIQGNSATREFEYPWAFHVAELGTRRRIVEIGGSLSGFQFVLSQEGHEVVNVDPGLDAAGLGWPSDQASMRELNALFGTNVVLKSSTIGKADLPDASYDLFFSISVLEHLPEADVREVMEHAWRCLKPGGRFVLTVDLFLNLEPFTKRTSNEYGRNIDVRQMIESSKLRLLVGERSQLFGYPEFSTEPILANLETYLVGAYPVLTQCMVLQKP